MIFYNAVVLACLLFCLALVCWNLAWFRTVVKLPASAACLSGNAPLISVLVPARNEALRITPCAASLASQRYPNYEVLILDDHSEDGTLDVLRRLAGNA